jgi:cell cycle checkpoint control protein RAD9A
MQVKYDGDGIKCEFLLMTVGERGAPGHRAKKTRANTKGTAGPQLEAAAGRGNSHAPAPPTQPAPITPQSRPNPMPSLRPPIDRPSQRAPPATLESESLFVPQDKDEQWEPVNVDGDEEEENARLDWDTSGNPVSHLPRHPRDRNLGTNANSNSESERDEYTHNDEQSINGSLQRR